MKTDKAPLSDLSQFTGSETWYRHGINRNILLTDGAKYVADECSAYWLLDEIALLNKFNRKIRMEEFQVWTLKVADHKATLTCGDGNKNVVFSKKINFTDFPLPEITLWCTGNTIMLPSEY
jgi:hypothetical protein